VLIPCPQSKDPIHRGKFQEVVCDLIVNAPDLATAVSLRYPKFVAML
jgi:hypothetical protein